MHGSGTFQGLVPKLGRYLPLSGGGSTGYGRPQQAAQIASLAAKVEHDYAVSLSSWPPYRLGTCGLLSPGVAAVCPATAPEPSSFPARRPKPHTPLPGAKSHKKPTPLSV